MKAKRCGDELAGKGDQESNKEVSDENKLAIIEHVKKHKLFYDSKVEGYKSSRFKKTRLLEKGCGDLLVPKMTGEEVLEAWNNLRRSYRTNAKKYKTYKSGDPGKKFKIWKFYEPLRWLDEYLEPTEGNFSIEQPHLKPTSSGECKHEYELISEDDPWVNRCAICKVFQCANCQSFLSFDNSDDSKMRAHTLKCFAEGPKLPADHSNACDPDRFSKIQDDDTDLDQIAKDDDVDPHRDDNIFSTPPKKQKKMKHLHNSECQPNLKTGVMHSLLGCLESITANCSASSSGLPAQSIDLKSSNSLYCQGLLLKLDRIYNPAKHGEDDHKRYDALEDLKLEIDQAVNKLLKGLTSA